MCTFRALVLKVPFVRREVPQRRVPQASTPPPEPVKELPPWDSSLTASGIVRPTELPSGITSPHFIMATANTSSAFTAGPWNTFDYGDPKYPAIIIEDSNGFHVAHVERSHSGNDPSAANARLIAQAPALLKSCQDFVDSVDMGDLFNHDLDCQEPETCILCIA